MNPSDRNAVTRCEMLTEERRRCRMSVDVDRATEKRNKHKLTSGSVDYLFHHLLLLISLALPPRKAHFRQYGPGRLSARHGNLNPYLALMLQGHSLWVDRNHSCVAY